MLVKFFMTVLVAFCLIGNALAMPIKIAVFPSNDPKKLQTVMDVLAAYLHEKTGDDVKAVVTRDYAELAERLREESVDIAWLNTLNYVRLKAELPAVRYIATYMEENEATGNVTPFYQSYIVALKKSGYTSLNDLKGKRFAFTDVGSTSGYAYPNMLLRKNGIDPDTYFKIVFFLKKHDRVIEALLSGAVDAGAVSDGTYFTAKRNHGDQFVILATSAPIPLDAIVARENLPDAVVARYRSALAAMPRDHLFCRKMRQILGWSAAGFEVRGDAFYDSTREALHLK
ncbi:phosphate/phosphite/phosphonate ABC transporter substrate-binding protein [Desulfovibrio sp. JY]|nr:phosphate/phosphite/phosphonate ABC transporter substrate-binding protein [Desulfovibrio sp. JY]